MKGDLIYPWPDSLRKVGADGVRMFLPMPFTLHVNVINFAIKSLPNEIGLLKH
jgi:hypothetical protein